MSATTVRFPTHTQKAMHSFWETQVLTTALRLDLFTHLDLGPMGANTLAAKLGCPLRGVASLLDGLVALGLVARDGKGLFRATEESSQFLVKGKPDYVGQAQLALHDHLASTWVLLDEAVRNGQPVVDPNDPERTAAIVDGWRVESRLIARQAAEFMNVAEGYRDGLEMLDIGGGSAVFGVTFARANKRCKVTQIDYPAANALGRKTAEEAGLSQNFNFIDGDYKTVNLGEEYYDIAILSNLCHLESPEGIHALFKRVSAALQSDGVLMINDYVVNDDRNGPPLPLLYSVNLLLGTDSGNTYTEAQYREWLLDAGFESVEVHPIAGARTLIFADK